MTRARNLSTRGTKMLAAALKQVALDNRRVTRSHRYTTPLSQISKPPRAPPKVRRFPRLCDMVL